MAICKRAFLGLHVSKFRASLQRHPRLTSLLMYIVRLPHVTMLPVSQPLEKFGLTTCELQLQGKYQREISL